MPTGSDRSLSPAHDGHRNGLSRTENGAASPSSNGQNGQFCGTKISTTTPDPTEYIQRARVTRPAPPKPSCNPMQFVQIKPCNLYQSAQEQLKKTEEVKKVKEIKKEEPEDWQSNLDNWKSSRRKRVEHIIDRVVEVKKLELEEHDRQRRKSKTFSEMMEERGERGRGRNKLASLAVYNEDESNDLSDLGIGTSSASGKSSLSEDFDNHSVMSDNAETEKANFELDNHSNHDEDITTRDYISSPGYDTSSSTAPASSPDPCEYEGGIDEYKARANRIASNSYSNGFRSSVSSPYSKDSTPERMLTTEQTIYQPRRGSKIEDRLMSFEVKSSSNDGNENASLQKKDLPKVDILKRRELFEKEQINAETSKEITASQKRMSGDFSTASKSIRDRLTVLEKKTEEVKRTNRLSGDITSIKDRLQILEKRENSLVDKEKPTKVVDVAVPSLKDRLSSLHSAVTKEEVKKPVSLIDANQLENMKKEDQANQEAIALKRFQCEEDNHHLKQAEEEDLQIHDESNLDTDREDSGIHTTDVSCSVSQTDEQPELVNIESHHHINEDGLRDVQNQPNEKLTAISESTINTIENEQQLSEDIGEMTPLSPEPHLDLENSVSVSLSDSISVSSQTVIFDSNSKLDGESHEFESSSIINSNSLVADLDNNTLSNNSNKLEINNDQNNCTLTASSSSLLTNETTSDSSRLRAFIAEETDKINNSQSTLPESDKSMLNSYSKSINEDPKISKISVKPTVLPLKNLDSFVPISDSKQICNDNGRIEIFNSKTMIKNSPTKCLINCANKPTDNTPTIISEHRKTHIPQYSPTKNCKSSQLSKVSSHEESLPLAASSSTKMNEAKKTMIPSPIKSANSVTNSPTTARKFDTVLTSPIKSFNSPISMRKFDPLVTSPTKQIASPLPLRKNEPLLTSPIKSINSPILNRKFEPSPTKSIQSPMLCRKTEPLVTSPMLCRKIEPLVTSPLLCRKTEPLVTSPIKLNSPIPNRKMELPIEKINLEKVCNKIDVNKLPDPHELPTAFIDVNLKDFQTAESISEPIIIPSALKPSEKSNLAEHATYSSKIPTPLVQHSAIPAKDVQKDKSLPNSIPETLNRPESPQSSLLIARLEVVETTITVTSNDNEQKTITQPPPPQPPKKPVPASTSTSSLTMPIFNTRTHPSLKPKNIFDFLKRNFNSIVEMSTGITETNNDTTSSVFTDNSKMNTPANKSNPTTSSKTTDSNHEVNIEITKTIKTEKIVERTSNTFDSDHSMSSEINQLLDEGISKLSVEDTHL